MFQITVLAWWEDGLMVDFPVTILMGLKGGKLVYHQSLRRDISLLFEAPGLCGFNLYHTIRTRRHKYRKWRKLLIRDRESIHGSLSCP